MELEIKHLAPYLPYGLKLKYDIENGSIWELDVKNIDSITKYDKPLLRPLSKAHDYFYKLFCETGKIDDFLTFETLKDFGIDSLEEINNIKVDYLPHGTFEVLAKHHFDLFDLIPNGLAEPIKENN